MRSVQHTSLALSLVAFSSVLAPPTALRAQDPRLAALETLRAMSLDSVDGAAAIYFRPADRTRALELQSMMQEFLGFWNPRLGVELHVRVAVLRPDDWSKVTPLPYGRPNNFGPPADLILAPAAPEPASGLDTILVENDRDNRDWLLVAHEGGHLLTLALLPPAMQESVLVPNELLSKDVRERFERLGSLPMQYWEYAANLLATRFIEAARPAEADWWMKYLRAWTATPAPRFTHLDDWFGGLMRTKAPDGKPVFTSPEGASNFGWYQGVVGQLAVHVQSRKEAEALSHIRRLTSGDVSATTAEIVEELKAVAGCRAVPAPPELLTDAERTTIGDTVRHLYGESSQAFDSDLDCEEVVDRLAPGGQFGTFVAQGELIELTSREQGVRMCGAIRQNRVSAREEIVEERVEVLGRDAAVLVTRGVYTVQRRDGQTMVRPQMVTTVWARKDGEWRRVHLHESWQVGEQPALPAEEKR